jgi:DNA-binding transcriptional ArsR family regulator
VRSNLAETFEALGDPTRMAIIGLLRKKPRRSSDIAEALDTTRATMSRQLRVLREAGLVLEAASEEDGRERVYRLRPEAFSALRSWIEEVESFWAAQLDSFKRHVERKARKPKARR